MQIIFWFAKWSIGLCLPTQRSRATNRPFNDNEVFLNLLWFLGHHPSFAFLDYFWLTVFFRMKCGTFYNVVWDVRKKVQRGCGKAAQFPYSESDYFDLTFYTPFSSIHCALFCAIFTYMTAGWICSFRCAPLRATFICRSGWKWKIRNKKKQQPQIPPAGVKSTFRIFPHYCGLFL